MRLVDAQCSLCGSSNWTEELTGRDREGELSGVFAVALCRQCGHYQLNPRPDDGQIHLLYPESYAPFRSRRRAVVRFIRRLLDIRDYGLQPRPRNCRVLELGCGSGANLRRLVDAGCTVIGIEPSPTAAAEASAFAEVLVGDDRRISDIGSERFDVIQAFMVLEHVGDPVDVLRRLRSVCVPGGHIELMVPNFESRQRQRFGADWYALQLPRHWHHFTPESIRRALVLSGWSEPEVWHQPTTADLWRSIALRAARSNVARVAISIHSLAPLLDLLMLPLGVFIVRLRGSSRLTVRATNPA